MASYNVTFWRPDTPSRTYSMVCDGETYRETLAYFGLVWVAIPTSGPQPVRIPPSCPKRFPTLQGGAIIHPDYHDFGRDNCRQSHKMDDDSPRMRRTDIVYQQCDLSPADIMKHANPNL